MAFTNRLNYAACAFWTFTLSIALLPIGLGGDRPVSFGLAQVGLSITCVFLVLSPHVWKEANFIERMRWTLALLGFVLLWAIFQTQPFVPASWQHPLWRETAATLHRSVYGGISIAPEASFKGISRLITYITAGVLGYVLTQDPKRARQLVTTLWITGTVICTYGLVEFASGSETILWFKKWSYQGDLTATFVNRNHFAIYAGMILTCGVALMMQSWREQVGRSKPHERIEAIRDWFAKEGLYRAFLLILTLICIMSSHSRAGLVLSLVGVSAYIFFYQIYLRAWRRVWILGIILVVGLMVSFIIAFNVSDRFAVLFVDYSSADRAKVYKLGWHILRDNPWLGYGINGFEPEYRLYQQYMMEEFNHAHSDILESLIDLGIPVGLMLWAAIAMICNSLWFGIVHRRQNGLYPTLALAATIMALGHALVDFDLQIPGVAMTWAALLGTGLSQSWQRSKTAAHNALA
jgi:O-antigen ligase